jgi:hypothetical protein
MAGCWDSVVVGCTRLNERCPSCKYRRSVLPSAPAFTHEIAISSVAVRLSRESLRQSVEAWCRRRDQQEIEKDGTSETK